MDYEEVAAWSNVVDVAEQASLVSDLPTDVPRGTFFKEPIEGGERLWQRVEIVSGPAGGRWAYWKGWLREDRTPGVGPHPDFLAIADTLFNGDAPHFIGMLGVPYSRVPLESVLAWVLLDPKPQSPRVDVVMEEKPEKRYEKSKELYDLASHTTSLLP